jgi:hypothetical protein
MANGSRTAKIIPIRRRREVVHLMARFLDPKDDFQNLSTRVTIVFRLRALPAREK